MAEPGGTATQSGIYYQNSLAALYLGRLCDPRPVHRSRQIISVRVEAPEHVDDVVVTFANGSRLLIQAKEALNSSGEAWEKLWEAIRAQADEDVQGRDEFLLVVGRFTPDIDALREACERARGKEDFQEWWKSQSVAQQRLTKRVIDILSPDSHRAFEIVRRTSIEVRTLSDLEAGGVANFIPPSSTSEHALFVLLRDLCGMHARVRKTFRAPTLLQALFDDFGVKVQGAPTSQIEEYRSALLNVYGRISVPGTSLAGPIDELFLWPQLQARAGVSHRSDFEEEDARYRRRHITQGIDLHDFPLGNIRRAIIEAGAGVGKTTLLRALIHKLAKQLGFVPALISLDQLRSYDAIDEYLIQSVNRTYRVNINWESLCESGQFVALFDGLDEVDDAARVHAIGLMNRFAARYREVPFLLAVRDSSIVASFGDATVLELQRLNNDSLPEFVRRYIRARSEDLRDDIADQINRHEDLRQLVQIPLYLAILLATIRSEDSIPRSRSEVLQRYLSVLLNPERHKERAASETPPDDIWDAAEILAFGALENNSLGFDEGDARRELASSSLTCPASQYLKALLTDGILYRRGHQLSFHFPIMQEYLAARRLVRTGEDLNARFRESVRRPWAQALQFALEIHPQADGFVRTQLTLPDDAFCTALRILARCIINGAKVSSETRLEVGRRLALVWNTASHELNQRIGHLIADGFAYPPSPELKAALMKPGADIMLGGTSEVIFRTRDAAFVLQMLEDDGLSKIFHWNSHWRAAIEPIAAQAIPILLAQARTKTRTVAPSNAAEAIITLSGKLPREVCDASIADETLPSYVRLAFYASKSKPIGRDVLKLVDQFISENHYPSSHWESLKFLYLQIDGWEEHFRELCRSNTPSNTKALEELLELSSSTIYGTNPRFRDVLIEIANDEALPTAFKFAINLELAVWGAPQFAERTVAMLPIVGESEHYEWARSCKPFEHRIIQKGIDFLRGLRPPLETVLFLMACFQYSLNNGGKVAQAHEPSLELVAEWCEETLNTHCHSLGDKIQVCCQLVEFGRLNAGRDLCEMLKSYLQQGPINHERWNVIAATFRAFELGVEVDTKILWDVARSAQRYPIGHLVQLIARLEGPQGHQALVNYYNSEAPAAARVGIYDYFREVAPRLGLVVVEMDGELNVRNA